MASSPAVCEWVTSQQALEAFVLNATGTQGQGHIRPLHYYVACRLVLEGGFLPGDITPHPPFVVHQRPGGRNVLEYDASAAGGGERTVLGGLKTKAVDVVVAKAGIGPVVAVSTKGTLNAFRNLTNRMEEAIGDCTNLHITYPALVYGYLQVIRATKAGSSVEPNDVCITTSGDVSDLIRRYHDVLTRLSGRADIRDESTRYEAVSLALVDPDPPGRGTILQAFPPTDSALRFESFFTRLYEAYDLRFVYAAPGLKGTTTRHEWDPSSPVLADPRCREYSVRLGSP